MVDKGINLASKKIQNKDILFDEKKNIRKTNKKKVIFTQKAKDNLNNVFLDSLNNEIKNLEKKDKSMFKNAQKYKTLNENSCHYTKETSKESVFEKGKNEDAKIKEKSCELFFEYDIDYIKDIKKKTFKLF